MKATTRYVTALSCFASLLIGCVAQEQAANTPQSVVNTDKASATEVSVATETKLSTFERTKLLPPDNKLLLFVGQDSDTISDYVEAMPEDNIEGITLYSQIKSADPKQTLKAMFKPEIGRASCRERVYAPV